MSGGSLHARCDLKQQMVELGSDSDASSDGGSVDDLVVGAEQLENDTNLVQEVEMDRQLWLR